MSGREVASAVRYLIAILLPPLAVLLCGKPVQFVLNLILTLCFWVPGMIHAILVVHSHLEDQRAERIIRALGQGRSSRASMG
ncbi:MAG: YqaE/Pmp3 family membrane protein [Pirellulales bacterium]|nr:YqaE/Pmp3 family membrane protein [Pirellulales bacterium]